jgi:glycosyltransferase involved in cell wall biosynthesis
MVPETSVIIPTFNRLDVLPEVLAAVENQRDGGEFEIVVVDDGSTDGTAEWLTARSFERPVQRLRQANAGPAAARNAGVVAARAPRVAFLGDDTVPHPGWLAAHRAAHRRLGERSQQAVIGYTGWHPRMRLTPFLRYINEYGLQFGYRLIEDRDQVPFNFFYTSNLSLSRERLLAEPFDTRFPYAAWEDIETSYRLFQRGLTLAYEPSAVTAHDHPTDLRRFADRQEKAGYSAVVFYRLHPELGGFLGLAPSGPPPMPAAGPQRLLEGLVRTLQNTPLATPRWWQRVLRYHYIQGLHRGWNEGAGETARVPQTRRDLHVQDTAHA